MGLLGNILRRHSGKQSASRIGFWSRFKTPSFPRMTAARTAIIFSSLFIAFLGIIIFRNQISTFFQSDPGADPIAYWKFDEGQGTIAQNSVGANLEGSLEQPASPNGGPTNIDNASDFGAISGPGRQLVRTSAGTLYVSLNDGGSCEIWKSTDGTTWIEQDTADNPACSATNRMYVAIDSSDILHILYRNGSGIVEYTTFTTSTDQFGSTEAMAVSSTIPLSISVDSNNIPHIIYYIQVPDDTRLFYNNRVGGTWNNQVTVYTSATGSVVGDITVDQSNYPIIALKGSPSTSLVLYYATTNDPSSFSSTTVDSTTNQQTPSIAIDSSNNMWIGYLDENGGTDYVTLAKKNAADAYTTWTTGITNSNVSVSISLVPVVDSIFIFYEDDNDDIVYDMYNGSTWAGESVLQTGTFQDVKPLWGYWANTLADSYSEGNQDSEISFGSIYAGAAQSFEGNGETLSAASLYLKKAGSPTGSHSFKIYAHSGTFGTNGVPTGTALATSDTFDLSSLTTSFQLITLNFSGANRITLAEGTYYTIVFEPGTHGPTNRPIIGSDASSPTHSGNSSTFEVSWVSSSSEDIPFKIFTQPSSPYTVDYLYSDATDVYWASLSLAEGGGGGTPEWKSKENCISGNCLYFDGTEDAVSVSDTAPTIKTVSFWIRPLSTTNPLVDLAGSADIQSTSGTLTAGMTSPTIYVNGMQSSTIVANKWQYVTVTTDSAVTGSSIILGNIGSSYFHGYLDEIKVYDYARSASQIKADYAGRASTKGVSAQFGDDDLSRKLSDGLVGYWKMDEVGVSGSNWTAVDSSGNNNNGTGAGNASVGTTVSGKFGNAGYFDGVDDSVRIPESTSTHVGAVTDSYTVSAWFNTTFDHSSTAAIIGKFGPTSVYPYLIRIDGFDESLRLDSSDGTNNVSIVTTGPFNDGIWHNVVAIHNGQTAQVSLYIDNKFISIVADTRTSSSANTDDISVGNARGASYNSDDFNGQVDEVRLYNRALDPSEVADLYNFAPGPIAYWKMDDGSGTSTVDNSGNSNTGALYTGASAPIWTTGKYGGSLQFDGTDDGVDTGSNSLLNMGNNDFTMLVWINPSMVSARHTIIGGEGGGAGFEINAGKLQLTKVATADSTDSTTTIPLNTFTHVAVTFDSTATTGNLKFYYNGIVDGTGTFNHNFTGLTRYIANYNAGFYHFKGRIDDAKIYSYIRTPAQIISDMNAGHPAPGSPVGSTVLHLKMDEGYGTTVQDYSPQNNDGTFGTGNSAPTWTNDGKFGKALSFDGTSDYVSISSFTAPESVTISLWLYESGLSNQNSGILYSSLPSDASSDWGIRYNGTNIVKFLDTHAGVGNAVTLGTVTPGQWTYFAVSISGTSLTSYMNGIKGTETTLTQSHISRSLSNLRVGHLGNYNSSAYFLNGRVDEVKIYPFALNADQVKVEYNQGQAQVMGALSTGVGGTFPSNSASRAYCVPGDSATCSGPVGEWLFNEGIGTSAYDTSGGGYTGTLTGSMTDIDWVQGKFGKALDFDGVNDRIAIADNNTFSFGNGTVDSPFSISAWVNMREISDFGIISKRDSNDTPEYHLSVESNVLALYLWDDSAVSSNDSMSATYSLDSTYLNKWTYIAITYDGSSTAAGMKMYINNQLVSSSNFKGGGYVSMHNETSTLEIGRRAASDTYAADGKIDQVRIYNYVRTPAQVAWEFNQGKPFAYYKLDECTGSTIKDWGQNANGGYSGNTGTLTIGASGTQTSAGTCSSGNAAHAWNNGTTGKLGASVNFDGTDDYVTITDNDMLDFTDGQDLSYSLWVKPTSFTNNGTLIAKKTGTGAGAAGYLTYINNQGKVATYIADGTDQINKFTDKLLTVGQWSYVSVVYKDDTSLTMYINGVDGAGSLSGTIASVDDLSNASPLILGAESDAQVFRNGQLDEVKIFKYALTPQQIKTEMAGGAVRFQ